MMKKLVFIAIIISFVQLLHAQDGVAVEKSPDVLIPKGNYYPELVGMVGDHVFINSYRNKIPPKRTYVIQGYHAGTMKKNGEALKFLSNWKRSFEDAFIFAGRLFVMTNWARSKSYNVFLKSANLETLNWNDGELAIFTHQKKALNSPKFYHIQRLSKDQSKLMIFYRRDDPNKNVKIGAMVLNQRLENIKETHLELESNEREYQIIDFHLTNEGDVFVLGKTLRDFWKTGRDRDLEIIKFPVNGDKPLTKKIKFKGKSLSHGALSFENGELVVVGYHSSQKTQNVLGAFFAKIDHNTLETEDIKTSEFSFDMLTANFSKKQLKQAQKRYQDEKLSGLFQYNINQIELREDGGYFVTGQQGYATQQARKTFLNSLVDFEILKPDTSGDPSDDILVMSFGSDGAMQWSTRIPRDLREIVASSHHVTHVKGNQLNVVYNDHRLNLDPFEGKPNRLEEPTNAALVISTYYTNGEHRKQFLKDYGKYQNIRYDPWESIYTNTDDIYFMSNETRAISIFKVSF